MHKFAKYQKLRRGSKTRKTFVFPKHLFRRELRALMCVCVCAYAAEVDQDQQQQAKRCQHYKQVSRLEERMLRGSRCEYDVRKGYMACSCLMLELRAFVEIDCHFSLVGGLFVCL